MTRPIIHLDGDAFFASCEVAQNEALRGRPVVVGEERGIATAVSYEAKARGVSRGMLMGDIRKVCPEVVIIPSHYDIYLIYSRRMSEIVRRYAACVEEYSIDECFAGIDGSLDEAFEMAKLIKRDLWNDLGMTFSVGVAPTKTLAKVASKRQKPNGLSNILPEHIPEFLDGLPIGAVWGIGSKTSAALIGRGVKTALEFISKPEAWVEEHFSKPLHEIWLELRGISVNPIHSHSVQDYRSIMRTRTFRPPSRDRAFIFSELCNNIELAAARLRRYGLTAGGASIFLKTQRFIYHRADVRFMSRTANPASIIHAIEDLFREIFHPETDYRATGVTFSDLAPEEVRQIDLFGNSMSDDRTAAIFRLADAINARYGPNIFLANSLASRRHARDQEKSSESESESDDILWKTGIPCWNGSAE